MKVRVERSVPMRTRDGVTLYSDVYRPDAEGRYPVLVLRTPYDRSQLAYADGTPTLHLAETRFFPQRGYVVVAQDTRGRFSSEGEFYPYISEEVDGYDTVEWAARLPWSNGRVAMVGKSYQGLTQYLTAPSRPPHLRAMAPMSAPIAYFENCVWRRGVFELGWQLAYVIGLAHDTVERTAGGESAQARAVLDSFVEDPTVRFSPLHQAAYEKLPVREWGERLAKVAPYLRDLLEHDVDGPFWQALDVRRRVAEIDTPMLHVGSWYDAFQPDAINMFNGVRAHGRTAATRAAQRLIIGPWAHVFGVEASGEVNFGANACVDMEALQLRWLEHWLKGVDTGLLEEPPVRIFVMGENRWRDEWEWPLARTRYTPMYLRAGGSGHERNRLLSFDGPGDELPDRFVYDPRDPVPTRGGTALLALGMAGGPRDQRDIEQRADVLVYTSDRLSAPVEVTGPVRLTLFASTSAPDTDFTAKLVDVAPEGAAYNVADGIIRARFRDSLESPKLLTPGMPIRYSVDLWSTSHVFKPGHRIRLDISSSDFPRYERNPNTGEEPGAATHLAVAHQTVFHDHLRPSHLVLPIIPR